MKFRIKAAPLVTVVLLNVGCAGSAPLDVTLYGEEFVESGIPATATADGWAIAFDAFAVRVAEVRLSGVSTQGRTLNLAEPSSGSGQKVATLQVPEGPIEGAAFTLEDLFIEGRATNGKLVKTFAWRFEGPVRYANCEVEATATSDAGGPFQITIHADHLFHDSLVASAPAIRFGALAAADTGDGEITREELSATDIGAYDSGSQSGIDDLWRFLEAQSKTLGHVNGEGHCEASAVTDR